MSTINSKVIDRIKSNLVPFQKILEQAKSRDINEADTVVIVADILGGLFGYEKYSDVTREYAVKGQFCDLAVKVDNALKFLIEVKAIGVTLAEKHYQQALNYGANSETEWFILTNGVVWKVYKVRFEKPLKTDFICEFNLLEIKAKNEQDLEKLYILCKEGIKKNAIDDFTVHKMVVNKYLISKILTSDIVIDVVKKELRKVNASVKPDSDEILTVMMNDILKRDVIDSMDSHETVDQYKKINKKIDREKQKQNGKKEEKGIVSNCEESGEFEVHPGEGTGIKQIL